jgi:hypothetical protein
VRAAYVDVDQMGMCYGPPTADNWAPEPVDDPGRHRIQTANVNAVAANLRDAGAACMVVSGVVDPEHGIDRTLLPDVDLTAVRLRADADELRRRLVARDRPGEPIEEDLREAELMDRLTGPCIDTTGLIVDDVVRKIDLPELADAAPHAVQAGELPGRILWIRGPREGTRSVVGWQLYRQLRLSGTCAAYVDLVQLGLLRPADAADPGNRLLRAANLAAVWRAFRAAGAECLVVAEPLPGTEDGIPGSGGAFDGPIV